jgi:hypothetical protein
MPEPLETAPGAFIINQSRLDPAICVFFTRSLPASHVD